MSRQNLCVTSVIIEFLDFIVIIYTGKFRY
jgi:hypothetical protein